MEKIEQIIANQLLQIKAIKLQPANPFTWASGWKSPIYCDNRVTLSFPEVRNAIKNAFADQIKALYPNAELIAGVATGAIAQAALVADIMNLPMIYVRPTAKEHGMGNQIEGELKPGQKVVVIEDLISTGGSSLKAVEALRAGGAEVLGMVAIFTYGFKTAENNFVNANVQLNTLSNYNALVQEALNTGYIT
ncbi:MAG TPA: orotate phosphoribosyltransferase, partial [Bacteroidales bacterium]|nr:orotate phosphoribosyltransferase [Bacteroidales bacterium]